MSYAEKTRVGVLRGGPSNEYLISLKTGATVLSNLPEQYQPLDIFIDLKGKWHFQGKPEDPNKILGKIDVVWNALHGEYGEDGTVQQLLEMHHIPFSGPKRLAAAMSLNKNLAKQVVKKFGIKTPQYRIQRQENTPSFRAVADELYRSFPQPCVIKPANKGSSIGVSVAKTPDEIEAGLAKAFRISDVVMVEEYIEGKEASCGVIDAFRGAKHYSFFPVEVCLPKEERFFNFEARYGGNTTYECPGNFSSEEKKELQELAVKIHSLIGLRHYSRSDFRVHPKRGIFFIEVDALPDLYGQGSLYVKALDALGSNVPLFLDHVLQLALAQR